MLLIYFYINRAHIKYINSSLFPTAKRKKFRGTHLLDTEDCYDQDNDDNVLFPPFAWSYGSSSKKVEEQNLKFDNELRTNAARNNLHGLFSEDKLAEMREQALVID